MVAILSDITYSDSIWSQSMSLNLMERLRSKRIPFCEITDSCPAQCDTVFIIASDLEWTRHAVRQLNNSGRNPIVLLGHQYETLQGCVYSCVCSDVNSSMRNLLKMLKLRGKQHLAIYGMNPASISDVSRANSLFSWRDPESEPIGVFLNEGSLRQCFDSFFPEAGSFDAVICTNDFAAISLVRNLMERSPEVLEGLTIVSCAETNLSNYYRPYISTLYVNFDQIGQAAVYIYESLRKRPYLSGMTLNVAWTFQEERPAQTLGEAPLTLNRTVDTFYQDPELQEMLIVDKLLNDADPVDRQILEGLSQEKTYDEIAELCFLSEGSIKYRVKRMMGQSNATSREEIVRLLKKYTLDIP